MKSAFITVSLCAAVALAWPAFAQRDAVEIVGHVNKPSKLQPSEAQIKRLTVPDGFDVRVFARDLGNPRIIAVAGNGLVYVTRRETGDVLMLRDENGDGKADEQVVVASRPDMHGIAIDGTRMYLATVNDVYVTEINADGTLQELSRIIDDLPEAGQHPNRTLAIGPEGMLFITVGSTCNACGESNPENATVLRASPDGSSRTIFASGLRNTIGFDWHPETGELWAMDHGIDWLGDNEQQEELNLIEEGRQYGWPYIYADGKENPQDEPPGEMTMATWREMSTEPVLMYTPHAAPMQLVFYDGDAFAEDYRGDAFVTFRGSWNRAEPSGYEVARVAFENGKPGSFEPFLTGFLQEQEGGGFGYLGRPVGLAVTPDGALLVADDSNGVIYRVAASGATASSSGEPTLGTPTPVEQTAGGDDGALAIERLDTESDQPLEVISSAFENDQPIPARFAAEHQNYSPPLDWSEGPEGTRSYAILMEDPDASQPKPFVHWIAYNIPADTTRLNEGVPGAPRLTEPAGALQGMNSRGSTGFFGMKPPAGDPPHRYNVQVFALDRELELQPGADREAVLGAMEGHVLGAGKLTGQFQNDGSR